MKIFFYKNGNQVGAVDVDQKDFSVLTLNIGDISKSPIELTATAPADFDEIGLGSTGLIDATVGGAITVRYAFVGKNGKYYIDSEDVNGIADFKKAVINNYPGTKFDNDELVLGECRGFWDSYPESTGNVINNNANDNDALNILGWPKPVTISAFGGNETYNLPFKKGMTVGFEISGVDVLKLIDVMKFDEYTMKYNGKKYSWKKLNELNAGFTLLGLKVGGGRQEITTTLDQDCNAIEFIKVGVLDVGGAVVYRMFVELPPSIDEDPTLTVSANRSLCDEKQTVTLHSDEAVTWKCTKTPEGAQKPTLKNATDGQSCEVSGFVNAGDYVFTATAKDRRTATTTVTYGVGPVINTAIRPWVNNFTEKGVSYSANAKQYQKWYKLTSFSLIPEIVKDTANLVTPSLDDYATSGGVSLISKQMLSCVFRSQPFKSDEKVTVGFVTRTKWKALDLSLLNGLKVRVYNAGDEVDEVSSENTHFKVLSANLINGQGYVTTEYSVEIDKGQPFDAITLWDNGLLGAKVSEMDIYYAFVEPSSLAQTYKNTVSQSWQTITHSTTGASIDASKLGTYGTAKVADAIDDLTNIIDDDNTNCATLAGLVNAAGNKTVAVKLGRKFEGGHQVKFIVGNQEWLNVGLLNFITLKAYCDGKTDPVATKTNWDVLSLNVIGGDNKEAEILWTPTDDKTKKPVDFDEISISFTKVAGVADEVKLYGIQVANDADGDGIIDANDDESCDNPYLIDENESELNKTHDYVHGKLNLRRYMQPDSTKWGDKGQWFSICLPVDLTFNQFVKTFGNKAELAKPTDFKDDMPGILLFDINEVYGNNVLLHKNTPYIIRLRKEQNLQNVDSRLAKEMADNNYGIHNPAEKVYYIQGVDYNISENNAQTNTMTIHCKHHVQSSSYPDVIWHCTFTKGTHLPAGFYAFTADGTLTKYNADVNQFRGLRCWMTEDGDGTTTSAKPYSVNILGQDANEVTGIAVITSETPAQGNIYSIDGQLIKENASSTQGLSHGVYIWNHKKIIIK